MPGRQENFPLKDSFVDTLIIGFMVSCTATVLFLCYYFPIPMLTVFGWYYWFTSRKFAGNQLENYKVAIIGTGFSGLNAAIECKNAGVPFVVFERNPHIGGTWWENTYLGCECDVPSHMYSFSFELNPNWSRRFSNQREILAYMEHCVEKYGLSENIRLKHKVSSGTWDEKNSHWVIEYENENGVKCVENFRFIIAGTGPLNRPNVPLEFVEGLREFRGQSFHTARWNNDCDLKGKRVAIIGSAASALQVVPHLCEIAAETHVIQRTPNWIFPKENYSYSTLAKIIFAYVPFAMRFYRWFIYLHNESLFWLIFFGGWRNEKVRELVGKFLVQYFEDENLAKRFTPQYEIGCKRILLSDNLEFYKCFQQKKANLVTSKIRITRDGIESENGEFPLDVIILATGFDLSYRSFPVKLIGRDGVVLQNIPTADFKGYLGVSLNNFPNLFVLVGPNTGLGHNSIIFMIENQVNYVMQLIAYMIGKKAKSLEVKAEKVFEFNEEITPEFATKVWRGCDSWYKDESGNLRQLWPKFTFHYWWKCLISQISIGADYNIFYR